MAQALTDYLNKAQCKKMRALQVNTKYLSITYPQSIYKDNNKQK